MFQRSSCGLMKGQTSGSNHSSHQASSCQKVSLLSSDVCESVCECVRRECVCVCMCTWYPWQDKLNQEWWWESRINQLLYNLKRSLWTGFCVNKGFSLSRPERQHLKVKVLLRNGSFRVVDLFDWKGKGAPSTPKFCSSCTYLMLCYLQMDSGGNSFLCYVQDK